MNKETSFNEFAIRSFRDTGDFDYIAARMAFRTKLYPQFLWAGLQAIEKYLKCVLLLNRIKATDIKHDLSKALELIEKNISFQILLSNESRQTINYFDTYGRFRYFEAPYNIQGEDLIRLDRMVWELRRYCRLIYDTTPLNGMKKSRLGYELSKIEQSEKHPPQSFKRVNGLLEEIVSDKKHPARNSLIWRNLYFSTKIRKSVKFRPFYHSSFAPLAITPEILDDIQQYVFFPKDMKEFYKNIFRERTKNMGNKKIR